MSRKQKNNNNQTAQPVARRKLRIDDLVTIQPMTTNQEKLRNAYIKDKNLVIHGYPGTGKTFLAMAYGLQDVLDPSTVYKKLVIIRSVVPSRDIGFLKGTDKEKVEVYKSPYVDICEELFGVSTAYEILEAQSAIAFETTSFIRGRNINNAVLIVDESQNLTFHELDSVITRVGTNTKIIFCGDYRQTDLTKETDKKGLKNFMKILAAMGEFNHIEFQAEDIVRSDLVKSYILNKIDLGF